MLGRNVVVRNMVESDCPMIAGAFSAQGWNKPVSQYLRYWQEHMAGNRDILLAEYEGQFAGYVTIVWKSEYPPFRRAGIPEIVDFNVLVRYQRMRVGTALMEAAEKIIALHSAVVGVGVCLHADYGAAQVLYVKRGYVPDGRGVFYQGSYPGYGKQVQIGDELVLYLTKRLGS